MSEPFIGQILMFGGNFAPRGWALCDGQLLDIASHTALFSILGTTYGGDGRTTFGLPDLRGRVPMHAGSGPGLTPRRLGEKGGAESVTLTVNQMPSHTHTTTGTIQAKTGDPNSDSPNGTALSNAEIYNTADPDTSLHTNAVQVTAANTGGNQSHENMPPFQSINFIIALTGTFPSRN